MESVIENDESNTTHSSSLTSRQAATNVTDMNGDSAHAPAYAATARPGTGIRPEHVHPAVLPSNNRE